MTCQWVVAGRPSSRPVAEAVLTAVRTSESPAIADHSVRSFLFAQLLAEHDGCLDDAAYDRDLLFAATVMHDLGAGDLAHGNDRFEVEGADLAAALLREHDVPERDVGRVWEAIALHTSAGIAERRGLLAQLTRRGVGADFGVDAQIVVGREKEIHAAYPRLAMARTLTDEIAKRAARSPAAAPPYSLGAGVLQERRTDGITTIERAATSSIWGERPPRLTSTPLNDSVRRMESYVERPPLPELAGVVRTVWIQRTGAAAYVQRHLPTGGVEIHFPIGGSPQLVGPLTGPQIEVIPPHTTIVGVRFLPGAAPPLPTVLDDLVDRRLGLVELWGSQGERLVETMAGAPGRALMLLQAHLVREFRRTVRVDPLVAEAVRALMPWHPVDIDTLATHLALSPSQLRRRCLQAVGMTPKVLQRTLRFQGFLALAQAGATATGRRGTDGMAGLAIDAGYADQAHLSRECLRLTGLTPRTLLGGTIDRCACGHDHSASYQPFLATRGRPLLRA